MAVGRQPLHLGLVEEGAGDRRVLGAPVGTEDLDPEPGGPLRHRHRHRRPPEAGERHHGHQVGGEVGVVEQAGEEVGGSAGDADPFLPHHAEHLTGVPDIEQVDGVLPQQRDQERVEHPDEVPHRRTGDLGRAALREHVVELTGLAPDGPVRVHDTLRITRRPRCEPDDDRGVGVHRHRAGHRLVVEQRLERRRPRGQIRPGRVPHHQPQRPGPLLQQFGVGGQVVAVPEAVGRHHDVRRGGPDDVADLLRTVEVDDRDHDGPEVRRGPERDARLHPVRQLDDDDVARAHSPGRQGTGQ